MKYCFSGLGALVGWSISSLVREAVKRQVSAVIFVSVSQGFSALVGWSISSLVREVVKRQVTYLLTYLFAR